MADDVNAVIGVQVDTDQATAQLRALQGQIQQFTRGMAKSSSTAAKAQRNFEKDLISNINASKQWTASFRTMGDATAQFGDALSKNKLSMGQYFKYGLGATRTFGKAFDKEMRTVNQLAERRVKSLQTQYIQLSKDAQGMMRTIAITPNNLDFSKYNTQMAMVAQRQSIFNDLVHKGTTELVNFGKNTQWAGRQLMVGFTLPLAAFGSIASKTFIEIEKAAIKFQKVYGDSFTTPADADKALKNIEDLASSFTKYGIAVKDTIDLAADLAAAGYEGARLNEAVVQTQRLAILGEIDQQTAMKTTISLQNAFNISSRELGNTINFLNAVENQTVVSLEDLSAAIPRVAPVIKGLGGDVQDLAVFLAAMKEGGVSAEQGANALKSGLASLINPSKAASEMLGGLGINIQSIIDTNKGDLMGIVSSFGQALAALDDFQKQQVLEKLFGKFQYARIGALFNNIVKDGSQANRALQLATSSAIELAATANKELKAVEDATSSRFVKAIEDIKAAIAPVGKLFLQIVTPVIEFGTRALEAFNGLNDGVKRIIATILAIVAGVGPVLLMTVGLVANGIGNFLKFINLLRNVFLKMTGQYKDVAGGTQMLTDAQLQAIASADSLAAAEGRVTQALMVQKDAVIGLAGAYAQTLSGARGGMGFLAANQGSPRGYNSGVVSVPGSGNGDTVPAMLTPGEAVIPAEMAKKYAPLIGAMISGQIPGYELGKLDTSSLPSGTQSQQVFAHIGESISISVDELVTALRAASQSIPPALREFQEAGLGQSKVRAYGGLGYTSTQELNELMKPGREGASPQAFLQDFEARGLGKWEDSLKIAGLTLDEVSDDLKILDTHIVNQINSAQDLDQSFKVTDDAVSRFASDALTKLDANGSKLATKFIQAEQTITEYRAMPKKSDMSAAGFTQDPDRINYMVSPEGRSQKAGRGPKKVRRLFGGLGIKKSDITQLANSSAQEMVSAQEQATATAQQSASPAERAASLGDDWANGYAQGIERSASQAAKASEDMVERAYGVTDNRTIKSEGMLGNDVKMVGGVPANPTQAQALIDAQYGPQQPAKRGAKDRLAGFALRKLKIDEESLDRDAQKNVSTKSQTEAIDGETKARRTSVEGLKTLNGTLMAGSMAVNSVAIGMSMMGGEVGEMGQKLLKLSSAISAVSMVLPLLSSPMGLIGLALMTAVSAYMLHNNAVKESEKAIREAAQKQSDALIGSAKAISEFQLATGAESIQTRRGQRNLSSEQASVYFQALTGDEMSSTLSAYQSASQDGNVADIVAKDLATMALNFDMTTKDIEAYSNAVATALGTPSLETGIRGKLIQMLYDDGETRKDLMEDPTIPIDVTAEIKKRGKTGISDFLGKEAMKPIADNTFNNLLMDQRKLFSEGNAAIEGSGITLRQGSLADQFAKDTQAKEGMGKITTLLAANFMSAFSDQARANAKAYNMANQGVDVAPGAGSVGGAALTGAAIGATIGSIVPGAGTLAGGAIGAGAGAILGTINVARTNSKGPTQEQIVAADNYYSLIIAKSTTASNLLAKAAEQNQLALESLNAAYEEGGISLDEYRLKADAIAENGAILNDSLQQQIDLLKGLDRDALSDFAASQGEIFDIKLEASDISDPLRERIKEFMNDFGDDELKLKAQMLFQTSGLSAEQFLIMSEEIKALYPEKDQEFTLTVMQSMVENNISLDKLNQYAAVLGSLPAEAYTKYTVDGELTDEAAAAIYQGFILGQMNNKNAIEGRMPDPSIVMSRAKEYMNTLKYVPEVGGPTGPKGSATDEDKGSGSGGKKEKKTWVQKRQEEWQKVQTKIRLEEAEVDAAFTKNFADNLNGRLKSAGLLNASGQLVINLPGAALNLGNITSQESLDAIRKKIELQLLNLEEKKIPHEKKIKALNKEISANNRIQELNKRKIDQINKSYENQSKALEQVSKIQDYMNRQRQAQTSLAEALSGGDLAAAVKAAQAAQAEQSKFILDNQKDTLDAQREAATFAYEEQNRLIDELNQSLQDQIYNEERALEVIQDQVDAYNEVTSAIDRAVKKMELLRDITKSAIVVQGPGGGLVTKSQAAANADLFGAADAVLGKRGSKENYYKSLDQAGYDQQILAGASAQLSALNAAKDAFNVSLKSDSLNALTQSIIDGLRKATFNVSGLSAAGTSGISASSTSNVYNSTSAPVYNISINVSNSNASPQDIASAVNQTIRSYNY